MDSYSIFRIVYKSEGDIPIKTGSAATTAATPPPPYLGEKLMLQDRLDEFKKARGVGRIVQMIGLRGYLKDTNVTILLDEIKHITIEEDLKILMGAGLRGVLYYAVASQVGFLKGL